MVLGVVSDNSERSGDRYEETYKMCYRISFAYMGNLYSVRRGCHIRCCYEIQWSHISGIFCFLLPVLRRNRDEEVT